MEECVHFAHPTSEIVGIVGRRILELREQVIDCGANFGGVRDLRVFGAGDEERIERHGGLFGGALIGGGNHVRVGGNAIEQSKRERLIVGLRLDPSHKIDSQRLARLRQPRLRPRGRD